MSSDLLFSILPREGKVPIAQDEHKVEQVSKEAKLRALNDQEKELNAEEREAREKYQQKNPQQKRRKGDKQQAGQGDSSQQNSQHRRRKTDKPVSDVEQDKNQKGPKHLDIYV